MLPTNVAICSCMTDTAQIISDWVEAYTDAMYAWALHRVSDAELAKDIVQDVFVAAYQKINTYNGNSAPRTWLFAILNNKIADHYRRTYSSPVVPATNGASFFDEHGAWQKHKIPVNWDADTHLLDNQDFLNALNGCMEKLPENWLVAVRLKYIAEKDGKEVCKELGISTTNFWQIMHRAKLSLRHCLELKWFK